MKSLNDPSFAFQIIDYPAASKPAMKNAAALTAIENAVRAGQSTRSEVRDLQLVTKRPDLAIITFTIK